MEILKNNYLIFHLFDAVEHLILEVLVFKNSDFLI